MADTDYQIRWRGRVLGPFSLEALKRMVETNQLSRIHEISTDGVGWRRAELVDGLFPEHLATKPPPSETEVAPAQESPAMEGHAGTAQLEQWFYSAGGQIAGPCASAVIRKLLAEGLVKPTDYASPASNPSAWVPISEVPQLNARGPGPTASSLSGQDYSGSATAALILGILGLFVPLCGPIAWSIGNGAKRNMMRSGNHNGEGFATAGVILGVIVTILLIVGIILIVGLVLLEGPNALRDL